MVGKLFAEVNRSLETPDVPFHHPLPHQLICIGPSPFSSTLKNDFSPKDFYLANYPKFFISAIISVILSIIHNTTIESYQFTDQIIQFLVLIILVTFIFSKPKHNTAHVIISVFLLMIMLVSLVLIKDSLIIEN